MIDHTKGYVEALNVSKTFDHAGGAVHAVSHVSMVVRAGEVVLVTGPSGGGKTTLLSVVGCMLPPSSGSLTVGSTDVANLSPDRLTRFRAVNIGFVFQSFRLIDSLSALENVELPLNLCGVWRPGSMLRAMSLLEAVGMAHRATFPAGSLSGGEKQRVAVARALANNPGLVLADEPTGNLDWAAGQRVIELLRETAISRRKAVLIVSHDMRIIPYADRVLSMVDGRIQALDCEGDERMDTDAPCKVSQSRSQIY
jgi:putative ABC transport system ATP-binding protein